MSDVIFSHLVSLPSMIYEHDCDTQLPNNLFDDDFHPGIQQLPPSRPNTEPTPISYMIAKARLGNELGNILQATNRVGRNVSYDEIIRFDAKLRQVMQELPPHLKLGPLEESRDPVTLIVARFNIDILFQRILCLLHRKYIPRARQNPRYAHSRRSAIEASLQAMGHLQTLHRESRGDGRLRAVSWYVKSIATKEFMLPAMLLVLDLHFDNTAKQSEAPQNHDGSFAWTSEERAKMISALEDAAGIWKSMADTSMEAFKASKVLEIMLQKTKDPAHREESSATLEANTGADHTPATLGGMMIPEYFGSLNDGMSAFPNANSGAFVGMDYGVPPPNLGDMQTDAFNAADVASPLSIFTSLGGSAGMAADLSATFDWVSSQPEPDV